jgi:nitrogenase molybdenum-iron protein alpha/beta subunit
MVTDSFFAEVECEVEFCTRGAGSTNRWEKRIKHVIESRQFIFCSVQQKPPPRAELIATLREAAV